MPDLDESLLAAAAAEAEKTEEAKDVATEEAKDDPVEEEPAVEEGAEAESEPEIAEDVEEPVKQTKKSASDTIRALKAERNAEKAERERLISELAAAKAIEHEREQQRQAAASAADRRAEEERLALLDPAEKAAHYANKKAHELENRLNSMQMQMQDNTDRAVFQAKAAHDPLIEKFKDQVEQMLNEDRKKGFAAPREEYLNILVGREVRKDAAAKLSAKKASAGKRIDAATSKPASARGDVAGSKRGSSEEDRLRGVLI